MKIPKNSITLGLSVLALVAFAIPAHSQDNFTSSGSSGVITGVSNVPDGTYYDFNDAGNWSAGVPNLNNNPITATIGDGNNVGYYGNNHGDLIISGGATLAITSGTFTQVGGTNYIQLGQGGGGNGNILINGGTFIQGTATSSPFAITGTGNTFTITSGSANFDMGMNLNVGLTYLQSGGVVNTDTHEFDINSNTETIAGGILYTTLLTSQNGPAGSSLNISGGLINSSNGTGIYGGNQSQVNFTVASTGIIDFMASGSSAVQGFINGGEITYNGVTTPSAFTVASDGGSGYEVYLTVPEPSTYALLGIGTLGMMFFLRRKKAASIA